MEIVGTKNVFLSVMYRSDYFSSNICISIKTYGSKISAIKNMNKIQARTKDIECMYMQAVVYM